ncbi:MAG: DUF475 domain-containing protein [Burkholderiaceae bacterium]|nr:DUF475 domain-containing protein [Burkholderiaceae bacterium]
MSPALRFFAFPLFLWAAALVGIFIWGGWNAFIIAAILTVLEVTLSFDNAVVNARVLARMTPAWQQRFVTWGIPVAVFGTRFLLPIFIVAIAVSMTPLAVGKLALFAPAQYGELLHGVHTVIAAFGGMFLLMVGLKYFFDAGKEIHWIGSIEKVLARFGRIEAVEIGIALFVLSTISWFMTEHADQVLFAGIVGILLYIVMQGIANAFESAVDGTAAAGGLALFLYLELLDAAFSLDGVIGAFAITSALPVIVVGLGVGAFFVRSLTIYLVREKTLDALIYLEHGAHWAILGLAGAMLTSIFVPIPEIVTGFIGIIFVAAAYWSSIKERTAASVT